MKTQIVLETTPDIVKRCCYQAQNEGKKAKELGKEKASNPYPQDTLFANWWNEGWNLI